LEKLTLVKETPAQKAVNSLYVEFYRRLNASPQGTCPVDLASAFVNLCHAQSCGKCVPCRIGLGRLKEIIDKILDGKGTERDLDYLEANASAIMDSADCAIGIEAASMVLTGLRGFREDYESHIKNGTCVANFMSVPCSHGCPAHVDIPGYIALIKEGRYADAIRVIRKDNPFPSVCSLICEHPCEAHCRRKIVDDDAVNIRGLKRFAVDNAGIVPPPKPAAATGRSVAVVGGGPTGLTAAYFLSLMGHSVTVFEKNKQLGGMLRYGIPSYRLPDSYLDSDINVILSLGVKIDRSSIGQDVTLDELREKYDAVYLAIGAHVGKSLGIEGDDKRGVMSAVEMLHAVGDGNQMDFTGKNVIVVGGGNVAMDATRTSLRLGAKSVRCVYRRRKQDMTALYEEIEGAVAEGCELLTLRAPLSVEADENDNVTGLWVQPQIIGELKRGRPAPRKSDKEPELIPCDYIIVAIGQAIDSAYFGQHGVPLQRDALEAEEGAAVPGMPGVFAGGDAVTRPATVIRAIEAGKIAANNIDHYLGFEHAITVDVDIPRAPISIKPACGRVDVTEREVADRKGDFFLMENPMTNEEAKQECSRCMRCDHYGFGKFRGERKRQW
jgi:NADPH-dependent glutamate synthase beta subunit-like oxidoreductase